MPLRIYSLTLGVLSDSVIKVRVLVCRRGCAESVQRLHGSVRHASSDQRRVAPVSAAVRPSVPHLLATGSAAERHHVPAGAVLRRLPLAFRRRRGSPRRARNDDERLSAVGGHQPSATWLGAPVGLHDAGGGLHGAVCLPPFGPAPARIVADVAGFHDRGQSASAGCGSAAARAEGRSRGVRRPSRESPRRQSAAVGHQLSTDGSQRVVGDDRRCGQRHRRTARCHFSW